MAMNSLMPNFSPNPNPQRRRGNCKFFNSQKGFGFVIDGKPEELDNQEVFVHWTAIQGRQGFKSLAEGEEVEYDLQQGPKGFSATNLSGPNGPFLVFPDNSPNDPMIDAGRPVIGDPRARSNAPGPNNAAGNVYGFNGLNDLAGQQLALDAYGGGYTPYMQHQFLVNGGLTPALASHGQMSPALGGMSSPNPLNRLPASLAQSGSSLPLVSPLLQQQQQMGMSPMMNNYSPNPLGYSSPNIGGLSGRGSLRNSPSIGGSGFNGMGMAMNGGLGIQDMDRFGGAGASGLGKMTNGTSGSFGGYGGMGSLNLDNPSGASIGSPVPGSGSRSANGDEQQSGTGSRDLLYSSGGFRE
ncbi:CSD-domain-containing protein [Atractiella rhizophila]|nr:CSD-domain-containing protein [Atractiella rhizophila]